MLTESVDDYYDVLVSLAKARAWRQRSYEVDRDVCLEAARDGQRMKESLLLVLVGLRTATDNTLAGVLGDGICYQGLVVMLTD